MRKRIIAVLMTGGLLFSSFGLMAMTAAPASATHNCVDRQEFRWLRRNFNDDLRQRNITSVFDTAGRTIRYVEGEWKLQQYRFCDDVSYTYLNIRYRLIGNAWIAVRATWR